MARLLNLWDRIRTGFWFIPGLIIAVGILAGIGMPWLDAALGSFVEDHAPWLSTTPASAGRTLSAFGGAIATMTGVVFSTTMVVLSLTSQQFGPRLLRTFLTDRVTQVTLGMFVGTSLYCLLVMRVIREIEGNPVAPDLSLHFAVVVSVITFGQLVYFIHHLSIRIQAPHVIRSVADDLNNAIDRLYPAEIGTAPPEPRSESAPKTSSERPAVPSLPECRPHRVISREDGYVIAVDPNGIMELAEEQDLVFELLVRPGDFVAFGDPLCRVYRRTQEGSSSGCPEDLEDKVVDCFLLGLRRTPRQDLECAISELVEIATRALSPGINDPFTAMSCLDYCGAAIGRLAERSMSSPYRYDEEGVLRVVTRRDTFHSALNAAFDQIRQDGRSRVDVTLRGLEVLAGIARRTKSPDQQAIVLRQAEMYLRNADDFPERNDRDDARERFESVTEALTP